MDVIENKVEKSGLIQLDLNDYTLKTTPMIVDIKEFLFEGVILKEIFFRDLIAQYNWTPYQGKVVGIDCSVDTILPLWAYMLISTQLLLVTKFVYVGDVNEVKKQFVLDQIKQLKVEDYIDKRVIVKGCGGEVPAAAYAAITVQLENKVKSLFFGEACSTVPVFKK